MAKKEKLTGFFGTAGAKKRIADKIKAAGRSHAELDAGACLVDAAFGQRTQTRQEGITIMSAHIHKKCDI